MKRSPKLALIPAFALILSLLTIGNVQATNVQLSGTVTTQSGFGIASVTVAVLAGSNTTVASTTTNASGAYSVSVPSGTYTVRATPPAGDNYQLATMSNQNLSTDTTIAFILTPVTNTFALTGRLVDPQGNGIPLLVEKGDAGSIQASNEYRRCPKTPEMTALRGKEARKMG